MHTAACLHRGDGQQHLQDEVLQTAPLRSYANRAALLTTISVLLLPCPLAPCRTRGPSLGILTKAQLVARSRKGTMGMLAQARLGMASTWQFNIFQLQLEQRHWRAELCQSGSTARVGHACLQAMAGLCFPVTLLHPVCSRQHTALGTDILPGEARTLRSGLAAVQQPGWIAIAIATATGR